MKKTCSKCGIEKQRSEFFRKGSACKVCKRADQNARYAKKAKAAPWIAAPNAKIPGFPGFAL